DARIARTRGLSVERRASASASERTTWAATILGTQTRAAATHQMRVRIRLLQDREISRRRLRRAALSGGRGRWGAERSRSAWRTVNESFYINDRVRGAAMHRRFHPRAHDSRRTDDEH